MGKRIEYSCKEILKILQKNQDLVVYSEKDVIEYGRLPIEWLKKQIELYNPKKVALEDVKTGFLEIILILERSEQPTHVYIKKGGSLSF